jgi:hypothetical protein
VKKRGSIPCIEDGAEGLSMRRRGFQGSTKNQAIFLIHVIRVHFYFNGLPDEAIRVACFYGE